MDRPGFPEAEVVGVRFERCEFLGLLKTMKEEADTNHGLSIGKGVPFRRLSVPYLGAIKP